jgi:two-component system response regulator QseB
LEAAEVLPVNGGQLEVLTRQVLREGEAPVRLSERECAMLTVLARNPKRMFSRRDLLALAFTEDGSEAGSEAVVDTYVHYLRRKLGRRIVATVHGRGYQLGRP